MMWDVCPLLIPNICFVMIGSWCFMFVLYRKVQSSILTPENTELIQKSIYTLIFTLKNIEVSFA